MCFFEFVEITVGRGPPFFHKFFAKLFAYFGNHRLADFIQTSTASIFVGGAARQRINIGAGQLFDAVFKRLILRHFRQGAFGQGTFTHQLGQALLGFHLGFDDRMGQLDGFHEIGFRTLVGLSFHHGDVVLGGCHDEVHVGALQLGPIGVDDKLAIDAGHAHFGEQAFHRDVADGHGGGTGQTCQGIGQYVFVGGQQGDDDLCFVHVAIGKQGAQCAVDQAADEYFVIGQPAFAAEEVARNAARSSEFFLVIDRKGKERLAFFGFSGADDGAKQHRVAYAHHGATVGLGG